MNYMPGAIVAIGGGLIRTRGTADIDREIIRLSHKRRPRLLFIPTASSDSDLYWRRVQEYFGNFLGCETDVLLLMNKQTPREQISARILAADVVYVGGGNTLQLMRVWRQTGVDKFLKAAYESGTVLSGISAGAICWFASGHSDSMSFYNPHKWEYINVRGMGLVGGTFCPHYNGRTRGAPRRKSFREMLQRTGSVGIAVENNCAIAFREGVYKVIRSNSYGKAYVLRKQGSNVVAQQIHQTEEFLPLETLLEKPGS
jgi:dipeptidase E